MPTRPVHTGGALQWSGSPVSLDRPRHAKALCLPGTNLRRQILDIESRSADNKRIIVEVDGPSTPTTYYLVDYAAKSADIVGEQYPGLADKPQGAVRRFEYAARDKYALFGYLTIPPGAEEKNLPLVVLPHGGPESDDTPYFDWWSQFLAARGYAVLRPQFRGSTGLGDAHRLRRPRPMGIAHAGRRHRWREGAHRPGHRRSEARVLSSARVTAATPRWPERHSRPDCTPAP